MKTRQRIRRSRALITTGIQFIIICLVTILVSAIFKIIWLVETSAIVAILVAIFTLFEYWQVKRFKKR